MVKADHSDASHASHRETWQPARPRKVSPEELAQILSAHRLYLETNRREGRRGNLSATDLAGYDLAGGVLRRIKLDHALLRGANLARADLQQANLVGADLEGACLTGADLGRARLSGTNLEGAKLEGALLVTADLEFAVMTRTALRQARLRGADIAGST